MSDRPDLPGRVTPEEVIEQRAKGWPDWHPEDYCHRCGNRNVCWWTDSPLWEAATDGRVFTIWCMTCLIEAAGEKGLATQWTVRRDANAPGSVRLVALDLNHRALPYHDDHGRRFNWDTGLYEPGSIGERVWDVAKDWDDGPRQQIRNALSGTKETS